jgi:hypothetical protein
MRTPILFLSLFLLAPLAFGDLIDPQTSAPVIVIPVAGDAAGANGTHFRSDMTVVNLRDVDQTVQFRWIPQGGGTGALITLVLGARGGIVSEDFVQNILHQTGIGAIVITGVTAQGGPDAAARLHATARIWIPTPNGSGGTMSQTFPAMMVTSGQTSRVKWIFGVRRDERYRLNVGIANPSTSSLTFRITAVGPTGAVEQTDLAVPAGSMQQIALPGIGNVAQIVVQNLSAIEPAATWYGWASSVDNISGDAWSQSAFPAPAQ